MSKKKDKVEEIDGEEIVEIDAPKGKKDSFQLITLPMPVKVNGQIYAGTIKCYDAGLAELIIEMSSKAQNARLQETVGRIHDFQKIDGRLVVKTGGSV